jgi:hypothetical protein
MLKKIEVSTALVFAAAVVGLVVGARLKLDAEYMAAIGGVLLAVASQMRPLLKGGNQ